MNELEKLLANENLVRRRIMKDRVWRTVFFAGAFIVVLPLIFILFYLLKYGVSSINLSFLIRIPEPVGQKGGGIANAIVGTGILIFLASLWAVPLSIFAGIFLAEFPDTEIAYLVRLSTDVLQGTPSIVIGIFAWVVCVVPMRHFSALAGSVALGIMLIPVVVKGTEETLRLIPTTIREASFALGVAYHRTIMKVIVPSGKGGIINGVLLGVTRISGETAPLLFTSFGNPFMNYNILKPISALPLIIYVYATSPYPEWHRLAWGASLILIIFVFTLNIITRTWIRQ